MGYIEKEELVEKLKLSRTFLPEEIVLINELIEKDRIRDNEAVLKEWAITKLEKNGLRNKFLKFCTDNGLFPQWVENARNGID
jgi:hypothetical protein